jgi:hypothetical protein
MNAHSILMLLLLAIATTTCNADDLQLFKITTKRDNDQVDLNVERDRATFSIHSPFGISNAVIQRTGEKWPETVILQLHLKGLENFKVTNDEVTLEAAVSSQDGKVRLWKDGKEDSPVDAESPYWMAIRMVGSDGKPANAIPLKEGHFESQLPKTFFEDNPKSFKVEWVDFYRN